MAYRLGTQNLKKGIYLTIENKYWDKEKKRPGTKHCKSLGYLHDLQKEYPNPITHFKEVVKQMNADEKESNKLMLPIDMNEELPNDTHTRYNIGYAVIMKIYHELEPVSYTHLRAHETDSYLVCRLLLEKK